MVHICTTARERVKHRGGNDRPRALSGKEKKSIGQYIRQNNEITLNELKENLSRTHHKLVSSSTISRHLHEYGYKNVLPKSTHILTSDDKIPRLLDWPSNSPDVNPIENIWSIIKRKVEKRKPKNIDELELFLTEEFYNVETNIAKNSVLSMENRCLSLISSKGERIKY